MKSRCTNRIFALLSDRPGDSLPRPIGDDEKRGIRAGSLAGSSSGHCPDASDDRSRKAFFVCSSRTANQFASAAPPGSGGGRKAGATTTKVGAVPESIDGHSENRTERAILCAAE